MPKSIKSYNLSNEASYANTVLQAFFQLECVQNWINYVSGKGLFNNQNLNTTLIKDLYLLFCSLSNGMNLDSSKIILDFFNKA